MNNLTTHGWNKNQKLLRKLFKSKSTFHEAVKLCKIQHALVHPSFMGATSDKTFFDLVLEDINENCYRQLQDTKTNRTILYDIWHSTRIEDITVSILVKDSVQVINTDDWQTKLNTRVSDTGNAMDSSEILKLSSELNIKALIDYRVEVARQTQRVLDSLTPDDLKRKFSKEQSQRIIAEKAVLEQEKSIWLIDFWGKKNVAGILLMPATRHHLVHINACLKLKKKCNRF